LRPAIVAAARGRVTEARGGRARRPDGRPRVDAQVDVDLVPTRHDGVDETVDAYRPSATAWSRTAPIPAAIAPADADARPPRANAASAAAGPRGSVVRTWGTARAAVAPGDGTPPPSASRATAATTAIPGAVPTPSIRVSLTVAS
jgi:hypothetical protein